MTRRPWQSFLLRALVFMGLPVVALLVVVIIFSQSWHHDAMQQMVGQRNLRAVLSASATIEQKITHPADQLALAADKVESGVSLTEASTWLTEFDAGLVQIDCAADSITPNAPTWLTDENLGQFCSETTQSGPGPWVVQSESDGMVLVYHAVSGETGLLLGGVKGASLLDQVLSKPFSSENLAVQIYDQNHELIYETGTRPISTHEMYHQAVLAGLDGRSGALYPDLAHHGSHVIAYAPIPAVNWVLVTDEAWEDIATPWINTTQLLPLALIPLLLLLAGGLWYGYRQIVRPLQNLQSRAADLSSGKADVLVKPVGGIAEIRDLQGVLRQTSQELLVSRRNLEEYIGAMTSAIENERKDLARELHDDALQDLIALKHLSMSGAEMDAGRIQTVIDKLRRTMRGLRPPYLEDLGLSTALQMLAGEQPVDSPVTYECTGEEIRLPLEVELAFFRIAQEALANIRKHAGVCRVSMSLAYRSNDVSMRIADTGRGFTPPTRMDQFGSAGKYGLLGMKERADLIGAQLTIESSPGAGSSVGVSYHLNKTDDVVSVEG